MAPSPAHRAGSLLRRAVFGIVFLAITVAGGAWLLDATIEPDGDDAEAALASPGESVKLSLTGVRSWGRHSRHSSLDEAASSPLDMLVLDGATVDPSRVASVKIKPDGSRRMVLGYLSAGTYTRHDGDTGVARLAVPQLTTGGPGSDLHSGSPPWLAGEVGAGSDAHRVRFWEAGWQSLVFGSPQALLDRLLTEGYDGVYLDHAGAHVFFEAERPTASADMTAFLTRLVAYARSRAPDFQIVVRQPESLASANGLLEFVNGVAVESLLLKPGHAVETAQHVDEASLVRLKAVQRAGKSVFVLEYADGRVVAEGIRRRLADMGFVPGLAVPGEL